MNVVELEVILHYAYKPYDIEASAPAVSSAVTRLFSDGLLDTRPLGAISGGKYVITAKGCAFVEALRRVPLPVCVWTVPSTEER